MKRLLCLVPVPQRAAAPRFRVAQYFAALQQSGIEAVLRPFLDDEGFGVLYRAGAPADKALAAARALAGRVADVCRSIRFDAVLIQREAALVGPPVFEWTLAKLLRRPIVFDLDDAVWVPYASPTYGALLSRLLKAPGKTRFSLGASAEIIAGNPYVAEYAHRFNDHVTVIPTVVDTEQFRPVPRPPRERLHVGWIGTHSSLQYLVAILPALRAVHARRPFRLVVSGGTPPDTHGLDVEHRPWRLENEASDFASLDVGLYPLVEDSWSLGKSGFKAVQYMACGVPCIASPVGVTHDMIRPGDNGLLATSHEDWVKHLDHLLASADERARLAKAGRADAVARYSLASQAPRFVEVVERAIRREAR